MKLTYRFLPLFLLLSIASPVWPQSNMPSSSADVVSVTAYPSFEPLPAQGTFQVAVQIKIQEGWHINAKEGLPEGFIPIGLKLVSVAPIEIAGPIEFPPGMQKRLAGETQAFPVYEKETTVIVPLRAKGGLKKGTLKIPFKLTIQACNDQFCLRPMDVFFDAQVRLAAKGENPKPVNSEMFSATSTENSSSIPVNNIIANYLSQHGLFLTFFLILLGGLALNLTPCVYPMIPITVSYFGTRRAESPLIVLGRATAYVIGISVTYSSLGVTAALTGKILGSTLQSPWVLGGISLLLVILSFSMFGLYEIQAPAWLLNKVSSGNTHGWIGAFVMGLVFGIVAAPCVDPFSIGLLTFVAAKADPFLGFAMFFTLSLGLGFPYLWLGFFSTEIQRLPKSGMWMVWVKKVFGLVLLGMPFYFLNPLMPNDFNLYAVPLYLLVCGILLGWVFSGKNVTAGFRKFQYGFGILLILLGLGVYQAWPRPVELPFQDYESRLVERAREKHQPVFIDFSASWCLPCKELEVRTFSDPQVREALKKFVLLKADLTQYSSKPVEELKKNYGIMGVPTLLFIGPDGMEIKELRVIGFISAGEFLKKLQLFSPVKT